MATHQLSIVIPVFNEESILDELWSRLHAVINESPHEIKVLFVDDGSADQTAEKIIQLSEAHAMVQYVGLSRNFGHQAALNAGIHLAEGDAVILMDGDLQDQPEVIPDFIKAWEEGADVVYAIRGERKESAWLRPLFRGFYRLLSGVSGIDQPIDAGIFGLLDRRVVEVIKAMPEKNRYFPGLRAYAGFKQQGIRVDRDARLAGETRVGLRGLFKLGFDAIFAFSYLPIRLMTALGMAVALAAFAYFAVVMYHKFFSGKAIAGWASILGAVLFFGGLQLMMLGLVGEYIARIYEETKRRPSFVIKTSRNLELPEAYRG